MRTCRPWKPVAKKKADPKTESAIVKEQLKNSKTWTIVKKEPNSIVVRSWKAEVR
jgi:hypothetical protein